jgi:hypothetical protein
MPQTTQSNQALEANSVRMAEIAGHITFAWPSEFLLGNYQAGMRA